MASSVFYRFKAQKDESRINFDGTGISVFDLKKEIILANNMSKANDFDLIVLDGSSGEEFKDDSYFIPRSSSVVVKRIYARPGKGKAAMYTSSAGNASTTSEVPSRTSGGASTPGSWHRGTGNISKRFDVKVEKDASTVTLKSAQAISVKTAVTNEDEAAAMAAMFQMQSANWEETQEKMSHAARIPSALRGSSLGGRGGKHYHHQPDRPLPASYVCYRCGQKGHWIQDCPTNNDRDYDNRPRIKRTTGIPRSFLKAVETPVGQVGQGVMVTPEGGYVVAQPDVASWQKQVTKHKGVTEADIRERTPIDPSLVCPIDNKLYRDAVKTPCCGTLYCEECIQTYLLERDFICPNCGAKVASLDKLMMDKPTRTRVADYIDQEIEKSKHEIEEEIKSTGTPEPSNKEKQALEAAAFDQEYYEQQPGNELDVSQIIAETIPQLQAQISQIQIMLNNPSLPPQVRRQTQMKHQQLQMELQQAQVVAMAASFQPAAAAAAAMPFNNMQGFQQDFHPGAWTSSFPNQQPASQDSAYQRLPLNNRRRNLKRERPSDFLEVGGSEQDAKIPRYWE
ncbi:DWNN-domain-containing protein [Laetiporus sulphureus 93-53]|uniref:DWNN-domain-containing protein n=1 Tax=Laetiporus sulphureus 93-53 TaxID=1314785 RepID=A0A165G8V5_9APHY|nr:DWNN-domain-containing protein [Laetiporus sulphureus 93-53]KZT09993.1 DWNN-domain-containing protein [Laetiporus sulphureus 93-53]